MNKAVLKLLPIDKVQLDINNPRIRRFLDMYEGDEPSAPQIFMALGAGGDESEGGGPSFEKLKQSILTNGGIIHPIIVKKIGDGSFLCIEGNTRLALYRSFAEDAPENWSHIPALVYDVLSDKEIDAVRLQIHLVGTRQWDPYSKAKYLHYLRTEEKLPFGEIVDYCGGRTREITELIDAYSDMEKYYRLVIPDDSAFDVTRFSGFVELQKSGIKESIISAGFELSDFARWINDGKLTPLNLVRKLPAILRKPEAREAFLRDGAKQAERLLDKPDLSKTLAEATVGQLAQALIQSIYGIKWFEAERIKGIESNETGEALIELQSVLAQFLETSERAE